MKGGVGVTGKKLTPKQERFVQEYLIDLNATAAGGRAGYKNTDSGRQLVTKSHVLNAVRAEQDKRAKRMNVTQDYVLERLQLEAERDEEGSSHAARVSALNLLGKHLGMFVDKMQVEHSGEMNLQAQVRAVLLERRNEKQDK